MLIAPTESHPSWLLVHTKPKQERVVVETLAAREIAAYCPRVLEPRLHRRAPYGPVPLFPSYVFARAVAFDEYGLVNYCPGASGVVRFGEALAAVEDEIVEALRAHEEERGYLVMSDVRRPFERGARVRITGGLLAGLEGVVTRYMPAHDRVRLLLKVVSGVRRVELDAGQVACF